MNRVTRVSCVAAFAAALMEFAPLRAVAQQAVTLEPLPEVVVTAGRTPEPKAETGSAISVVARDTVATSNPSSIADALRSVPGVTVVETGGPGATTTVMLRGANSGQTLVLIDGIRVGDPTGTDGGFDFANLAPGLVDHIEVLRGPQSALYGSDAIGGVVNVITKKGEGPAHGDVGVTAGRYGTVATNASVSGSTGPWSYAFAGTGQQSDGFSRYGYRIPSIEAKYPMLEADGFQRFGGYGHIGYDPGSWIRVEAGAFGTHTRSDYDAASGSVPDTPSVANQNLYQVWGSATSEAFGGAWVQSVTLSLARALRNYYDVSYAGGTAPINDRTNIYGYIGDRLAAEYQGKVRLGAFGTFIYGGRLQQDKAETFTTAITPVYKPLTQNIAAAQDTRALFALWELPIAKQLFLSVGGRVDDVVQVQPFATWRATAAYLVPGTGAKFHASAGTGAKAPTLYQLYAPIYGNGGLLPERSFGWDAGYDQTFLDGRASFSTTYFSNRLTNLINFDAATSRYLNTARAATSGLETEAAVEVLPTYARLRATYTYLRAIDLTTNLDLQRRPTHSAQLALSLTPLAKWRIEPRMTYVSQRYNSNGDVGPLAPYVRLDLFSDYRVFDNLTVFGRVENLTNVRYQEVLNYGTTGRAGYAGFNLTW